MAELQAAGTAFAVEADLALKGAKLVRKVIQARADATTLHHKMKHLRRRAERIGRILEERQKKYPAQDRNTQETIIDIQDTLTECETCLRLIEQELDPLDVIGTNRRPPSFSKRLKYVCSQSYIKHQESLVETHLDNLRLDWDVLLLQSIDESNSKKAVRDLNRALVHKAATQRSNMSDLSLPDSDGDPPSPTTAPSSDEDELETELSSQCPECHKLHIITAPTNLSIAVKHRQADRIRPLIAEGEDVGFTDVNDWTLLHHSAHLLDHSTTYQLLEARSSSDFVDAKTGEGQTALMLVASQADVAASTDIAHELIKARCKIDQEDDSEDKRTALWWAVNGSHSTPRETMVDLLVSEGAKVASVRNGKLKDKAKFYPQIEEAAKIESTTKQDTSTTGRGRAESTASNGSPDGLGRRLTKVFSGGT